MILASRADMPIFGLIDASVFISSKILLFSIALEKFTFVLINMTKRVLSQEKYSI